MCTSMKVKKTQLPCWPSIGQQVSYQRWIWGIHWMQGMKHANKEFTLALKLRAQNRDKDWCPAKRKQKKVFLFLSNNFLTLFTFNASPLIPLFWTSGDSCLGFQSQGGSLACVLCCLLIIESSHSPLLPSCLFKHWWESELVPHCAADRLFNRMKFCASVSMAIHWLVGVGIGPLRGNRKTSSNIYSILIWTLSTYVS